LEQMLAAKCAARVQVAAGVIASVKCHVNVRQIINRSVATSIWPLWPKTPHLRCTALAK